jgi:hypothetical protein
MEPAIQPPAADLPRQAVVIFHDDGRLPRRDPVRALADDGDEVSVTHAALPVGLGGRGHTITWAHDAESLVLSQQADAPLSLAAACQTDVLEVAWNPTAGRRRRAHRGPLPTSSPLWRRAALAAARRYLATGHAGEQGGDGANGSAVRAAAGDLLDALHAERDPSTGRPRYDRVVVIGAGLGSVVGYAAVHDCWARRAPLEGAAGPDRPGPAHELERARRRLAVADARVGAEARSGGAGAEARSGAAGGGEHELVPLRTEYRRRQTALAALLREESERGPRRWIVSDLVTMGSPLARTDVLTPRAASGGRQDPHRRVGSGELSACPPPAGWADAGAAGAFAAVRWTNLWFVNDAVAGPVAGHLGAGVEDVDLGGPCGVPAFGTADRHARYWLPATDGDADSGLSTALLRLMVRRRPTLLLTARRPVDSAVLVERLLAAACYPTARGAVLADVRLIVAGQDGTVRSPYLPVGLLPLPADLALREVRAVLGPGGTTSLLLSGVDG